MMFESYQITSSTDKILSRFSISLNEYSVPIKKACTIKLGAKGYVITSEGDRELRRMKFGFTPHWTKTPMDIITARAEGDKNQDNDPYYNGPNSIFLNRHSRRPFSIIGVWLLLIHTMKIQIDSNNNNLSRE